MTISKEKLATELLTQVFVNIPFNRMLGLQLDHLSTTEVIIHFKMQNDLIGNYLQQILHGGVISAVLDMTGGMLVMTKLAVKHADKSIEDLAELIGHCSTTNLHINYLRPGKGTHFTAKASLLKSGSKLSFTHMELLDQDGQQIATANGTYITK
jgi:uncharacterized protein (TIGR00369 family)